MTYLFILLYLLCCIQCGAIINKTALNILVYVFWGHLRASTWQQNINHGFCVPLTFLDNAKPFSEVNAPTPPAGFRSFCCTMFLPTTGVIRLFPFSHPGGCLIVSHCSCNFHFPDQQWSWGYLHMFIGHIFSLEKSLFKFLPIFSMWLSLTDSKEFSYVVKASPFLITCVVNIFSHSVLCGLFC